MLCGVPRRPILEAAWRPVAGAAASVREEPRLLNRVALGACFPALVAKYWLSDGGHGAALLQSRLTPWVQLSCKAPDIVAPRSGYASSDVSSRPPRRAGKAFCRAQNECAGIQVLPTLT